MKKIVFSFMATVAACAATFAQLTPANTPDGYGYIWLDQNSANGPTYNWQDITTTGTEVSGLADDNVVGPISLGMTFKFYWNTYDKIWIGSNGYIAFNSVNIASSGTQGFPAVPASDGKNGIIAPMLCDLILGGTGSTAKVFTKADPANKKFIITYDNVPFWVNNAQGWDGANTFQIILDGNDNSIVVQYQNQTGSWNPDYDATTNPMVLGIENSTGAYGLFVANKIKPTANTVIKFIAPTVASVQVTDVGPENIQNPQSAGFFVKPQQNINVNVDIANTGNVDITSQTVALATIRNSALTPLYTASQAVPSIPVNTAQNVTFTPAFVPNAAGSYLLEVKTNLTGDMNADNDIHSVEMVAIDTTATGEEILSFVTYNNPNSGVSWSGGSGNSGGGVYFPPMTYPTIVTAVELVVLPTTGNATYTPPTGAVAYKLQLLADDGAGGSPGSPYAELDIDGSDVTMSNATNGLVWKRHLLPDPIILTQGGLYAGWIQNDDKVVLAAEDTFLISKRTYEILGGTWAAYRSLESTDFYIRLITEKTQNVGIDDFTPVTSLQVFPNPSKGSVNVTGTFLTPLSSNIKVTDMMGRKVYQQILPATKEFQQNLDLNHLAKGVYLLEIATNKGNKVQKLILE